MNYYMTKTLLSVSICLSITAAFLSAATVPAGTTIVVRTGVTISSRDRVGRTVVTQLDQNVAVQGKTLLPAGTKVLAKVETSQADSRRPDPLTVNLTSVSIAGQTVTIKTDGAFQVEAKPRTARQMRTGVSVGSFTVPSGTKMQFRLAQPLNL
jgi:nucleoid DNA-binding protein